MVGVLSCNGGCPELPWHRICNGVGFQSKWGVNQSAPLLWTFFIRALGLLLRSRVATISKLD